MQNRLSAVTFLCFIVIALVCFFQTHALDDDPGQRVILTSSSPFSTALETLQMQINYSFQNIALLRRAMTHASFSEENNNALSIMGNNIIRTSLSLRYMRNDIDISAKQLNQKISEVLSVKNSCAVDGERLGLDKVVRVSPKTNSSTPSVVCGAYRAIFGAVALDTGKSDDAGDVFWSYHGRHGGFAVAW